MRRPPSVAFPRRAVHGALDQAEVGWTSLARAVTLPDMGAVAVDLVVEGVVDCYLVVSVAVDCVGQQLKAYAVTCPIISPRVSPGCRDEEVGVDCFVE
jgi:hypothetical protein